MNKKMREIMAQIQEKTLQAKAFMEGDNKDVAKAITNGEQDYTNNKAAIKEIIDGGYTNPFLGGQDHLSLLTAAADKVDLSNKISAYDQGCNEKFQAAMKDYFTGKTGSYEEALKAFKKSISALYGNLNTDNLK